MDLSRQFETIFVLGMALQSTKLVLMMVASGFSGAVGCSIVAVGREASASGYPMVAHTEDAGMGSTDIRLIRVAHQKWPAGSMRPIYHWQFPYPRVRSSVLAPDYAPVGDQQESEPLARIPQVSETYAYWDTSYGVQNEVGLSIGESTCDSKTVGWPVGQPGGYNRVGIEDLTKIALERCATARCAVQLMGKLAVELGFYSADSGATDAPDYTDTAEALVVIDADPGDAWIFHVMTGRNNASAIWAAQRVPPSHVASVDNSFTITKMNLTDSANFLYSPGVTELAVEKGWWSPELEESPEIFDFYHAYGYMHAAYYDRMVDAYYAGRRMWRVYSLLSPEEGSKLDPNKGHLPYMRNPYPPTVAAPKGSVSLRMVFNVLRDHYEGTPYDLTQGMAAGPFGNPNRATVRTGVPGQWERALSMYRACWSFVLEAKPNKRGVTWFGWDAPHGTAYLPFFASAVDGAPASYRSHTAHMSKFSTDAAFWAFNLIDQYEDLNFRAINADVRAKGDKIEDQAMMLVAKWEDNADKMTKDSSNPEASLTYLTKQCNSFVEVSVNEWWDLAWSLIGKYRGFLVTHNETFSEVGDQAYPEWWLRSPEVGFSTWKPIGPFHGVVLDEKLQVLLQDPAQRDSGLSSLSVSYAWVLFAATAFVAVVGRLSYQAGLQKGRASFDVESCYFEHQ